MKDYNRCLSSGNSGQRRAEYQERRELQKIETQYKMRVMKRQIAGMFEET
jgi:hypothetical protein